MPKGCRLNTRNVAFTFREKISGTLNSDRLIGYRLQCTYRNLLHSRFLPDTTLGSILKLKVILNLFSRQNYISMLLQLYFQNYIYIVVRIKNEINHH